MKLLRPILRRRIVVDAGRAARGLYWRSIVMPRVRKSGRRRTALASFPRSGNTWMRALLEAATDDELGSKYDDRVMARGRDGLAIKTHGLDSYAYTDAIHVVRNPFDAVWSYYRWTREFRKREAEWPEFSRWAVRGWERHARHWSSLRIPTVFVRFEDLRAEPERELARVLEFLGRDADPDRINHAAEACGLERLREAHDDRSGRFFRSGAIGGGLDHFDARLRRFTLDTAGTTMRNMGYEELADHAASPGDTQPAPGEVAG